MDPTILARLKGLIAQYDLEYKSEYLDREFAYAHLNPFEHQYIKSVFRELLLYVFSLHGPSCFAKDPFNRSPSVMFDLYRKAQSGFVTREAMSSIADPEVFALRRRDPNRFDEKMQGFILTKLSPEQLREYQNSFLQAGDFALSQHTRLGANSPARDLDPEILGIIGVKLANHHTLPSGQVDAEEARYLNALRLAPPN